MITTMMICRPYDTYGCWYNNTYVISSDHEWLNHTVSCNKFWINRVISSSYRLIISSSHCLIISSSYHLSIHFISSSNRLLIIRFGFAGQPFVGQRPPACLYAPTLQEIIGHHNTNRGGDLLRSVPCVTV